MKIEIRQATPADAVKIGEVVAMALGFESGHKAAEVFAEAAAEEDTQYSYQNALVATADGKTAGIIVAYDGGRLAELREGSLKVIRKYHPDLQTPDDETEAGEMYVDSLGVFPEYRGQGIAHLLLDAVRERASEDGLTLGLLADYDNRTARRLYTRYGFRPDGEKPFFGHTMQHLILPI